MPHKFFIRDGIVYRKLYAQRCCVCRRHMKHQGKKCKRCGSFLRRFDAPTPMGR